MLKRIEIPFYIKKGVIPLKDGFPKNFKLFVGDTETVEGDPYMIQLFDGETMLLSLHEKENILDTFVNYLDKRALPGTENIIYFHNLDFDLPVILNQYHEHFCKNNFKLIIPGHAASMEIFCGKMTFANLYFADGRRVNIYDSYRFIQSSLSKAAIDLKLTHKKVTPPPYLGKRKPKPGKEYKDFCAYASGDVQTLWELGSWITDQCKRLDTPIPLSTPHWASILLRKKFMKPQDRIIFPPIDCVRSSILSYHGGKNGLYIDTPVLIPEAYSYDIISAYPWAMSNLPSFLGGHYVKVNQLDHEKVGIYSVDGTLSNCAYGSLYDHNFSTLSNGPFKNKCFTSYEIESATRKHHLSIDCVDGWVWEPKETRSPLKDFVDYFYEMKSKSDKSSSQYILSKLTLNSLYGKFVQTINYGEENFFKIVKEGKIEIQDIIYKAGGLFNPFIGSLITGMVRSKLHDLEHAYKAIHSSTDSIITLGPAKTGERLGDLKLENKGPLLLVREKLYVHFLEGVDVEKFTKRLLSARTKESTDKLIKDHVYKAALHGFHSDIKTLLKLWKTGSQAYEIQRMIKIKEAFKNKNMNLKPLTFHSLDKTLQVDWKKFRIKK